MSLLSWTTAAIVGGIAVPLLLLLYFLKLRRQERKVSSTLLWKKAVQDLQVNSPFQKLRRNLLLLLQMIVLAALLFAIADPVARFMRRPEKNIVLLLDRSASMKTRESADATRMDAAREAALDFIRSLPGESRAMVIAFSDKPEIACSFTHDKRRLEQAIERIEPVDGPSRIGEALQLAVAYSSNLNDGSGAAATDAAQQGAADLELFSDGRIADAEEQSVTKGNMRFYRIGEAADNVGIVAFDIRREIDRPGVLTVFARVQNFGPSPVTTDVSLSLDGKLLTGSGTVQEVALGPAESGREGSAGAGGGTADPAAPREEQLPDARNVLFELGHEQAGTIEVKLHREDAMMVDNRVAAPIDPPRELRVLLVTDRAPVEYYVTRAVRSFDVQQVDTLTPARYEAIEEAKLTAEGRSAYDLVILDRHDTDRLPPGNYLFLGGLPKVDGVARGDEVTGTPIVYANEAHPLIRSVNYEAMFVSKWHKLKLPGHAQSLIEGESSPIMVMLTDPGHRYVITTFDVLESDLLISYAFPVFVFNSLGYLAGGGTIETNRMIQPGATITLTVPPGATTARVRRPDGQIDEVPVADRGTASYARTSDTGLYRVTYDDSARTVEPFAVNLLDAVESHIAPNESFEVGSQKVASISGEIRINQPLWPYAIAAAIAFLLLEWWIYNRRVMV
ncbi:hypothetical protein RAS2_26720 [Phycisphaerae bacterium RAS2]|nr:hypothetical protein RAS2_26720 [Phycisphaerae bacterium RAS2]